MEFKKFGSAVARQFAKMSTSELFCTRVDKDEMYDHYLASYPEGTNPIFRERTEHDCSCCRQFIKTVGHVVSISDGKLTSIWDTLVDDPHYQVVANAMSKYVKSKAIDNIFRHTERVVGQERSFEDIVEGGIREWNHFSVNVPSGLKRTDKNFILRGDQIGPLLSATRADHDVLARSLAEITDDSIDTVLDLIKQNSLYRGEEHKFVVTELKRLKKEYNKLDSSARDAFAWDQATSITGSVKRVRNTSIGTLLVNLSEGMDLEDAVRKFEALVAPSNYKRPTALVTPAMVEKAKVKIAELGLTSALQRRYANVNDISINDLIYADRQTKSLIEGSVFDNLATKKVAPKLDKIEEVSIDHFLKEIVPTASSIELFIDNGLQSNLVSLIAPVDPTANRLFKWDNLFSWSYSGDVADAIKERVKQAGGNVTGDLCCRLAWYNYDDLDLHLEMPNKKVIAFYSRSDGNTGGMLDVDMNAGGGRSQTPVENIFFPSAARLLEGKYKLKVNQYCKRAPPGDGYDVQIDFMGEVHHFHNVQQASGTHTVAEFEYTRAGGFKMLSQSRQSNKSIKFWGLESQDFRKVSAIMFSPNYWGDQGVGNKHFFFMLDKCENEGQARGFFNEFLREDLNEHRKVIELVGAKSKTEETVNQLSGVGFSSTQRRQLIVRVGGSFTRTVKVNI